MSEVHFLTVLEFLPLPCALGLGSIQPLLQWVQWPMCVELLLICMRSEVLSMVTLLVTAFKGMVLCSQMEAH
jgi:hypothetical protein